MHSLAIEPRICGHGVHVAGRHITWERVVDPEIFAGSTERTRNGDRFTDYRDEGDKKKKNTVVPQAWTKEGEGEGTTEDSD